MGNTRHVYDIIYDMIYIYIYIYDHTDISNFTLLDHDFATIWCIWSPFWRSTPVARDLVSSLKRMDPLPGYIPTLHHNLDEI